MAQRGSKRRQSLRSAAKEANGPNVRDAIAAYLQAAAEEANGLNVRDAIAAYLHQRHKTDMPRLQFWAAVGVQSHKSKNPFLGLKHLLFRAHLPSCLLPCLTFRISVNIISLMKVSMVCSIHNTDKLHSIKL